MDDLTLLLTQFPDSLRQDITRLSRRKTVPKGATVMEAGQLIQVIPIVLRGLLKVITRHEDKEFLLYYIEPSESCIMSFFAVLRHQSSPIIAVAEEETELLLLPTDRVRSWAQTSPEFNAFFHQLNSVRYTELIQTIHALLFDHLDDRILHFLREKARLTQNPFVRIRHREIADALGTSREAVSRVTKKLEHEKKLVQHPDGIEVRL